MQLHIPMHILDKEMAISFFLISSVPEPNLILKTANIPPGTTHNALTKMT